MAQSDLDALAAALRALSTEPVVEQLAKLLLAWKDDDSTVEQLDARVERYLGHTWIRSDAEHEAVYARWTAFRNHAICGIHRMPKAERLARFGLTSRFERAGTPEARKLICSKVLTATGP